MAIKPPPPKENTRELLPAGNHMARCYQIIQIGTVKEIMEGKEILMHKVRIGFEFPTELRVFDEAKGEQPMVKSKEYTLSLDPKANLRRDLKSWRGKDFTPEEEADFDITRLVGASCMVNIIHKPGKKDPSVVYEDIAGITPMPKGFACPPAINKPQVLEYENFDMNLFESLPDFIRDKIKVSQEYQLMTMPNATDPVYTPPVKDDDLPF